MQQTEYTSAVPLDDDSGAVAKLDIFADELGRVRQRCDALDKDLVNVRIEMAATRARFTLIGSLIAVLIPTLTALFLKLMH